MLAGFFFLILGAAAGAAAAAGAPEACDGEDGSGGVEVLGFCADVCASLKLL